jgi:hypothetical protein
LPTSAPSRVEESRVEKSREEKLHKNDDPDGSDEPAAEPPAAEPTLLAERSRKTAASDPVLPTIATEDRALYAELHAGFQRPPCGRPFVDFAREGAGIKRLIAQARRQTPDDPAGWLKVVVGTFRRLRAGPDHYWQDQPFLPSVLASGGILPRVLEAAARNGSVGLGDVAAIEEALGDNR